MQNQKADLEWSEKDIPLSTRFDDFYYSTQGGLEETRYVFLQGNQLPERFHDGFHIGELGFGTGLGFLTAVQAWRQAGIKGQLHFTSFEAFPMQARDMLRALAAFPELSDLAGRLAEIWRDQGGRMQFATDVTLEVITGDARTTLPAWEGRVDAWFLDGFSPAKNPELWEPGLMRAVALHTKAGGSAATYTAAGFVRRGLHEAGFEVTRIKGYGRKRHMSIARLPA